MIMTCVFLSLVLGYIPVVGTIVETIFFCWVDACVRGLTFEIDHPLLITILDTIVLSE